MLLTYCTFVQYTSFMPPAQHLTQLKTFYHEKKRMPSYQELKKILGFSSKNAVTYWVQQWIKLGLVERDKTGRLLPGKALRPLRLLGEVQAGFPSPAEEENVDTLSLDDWLIEHKEASFMLKVSGDSMIDAGIHPGDFVILERGRAPKNGDIVVAEVDHEWTMKFFDKKGALIMLRPANRKYQPIRPREELKVAGVVTAVIRKF